MPLGASRLNFLSKVLSVGAAPITWDPLDQLIDTGLRFDATAQTSTNTISGLQMKTDETKMYLLTASDVIYQYSLTAGDLSTATYDSKSFNMSAEGDIKEDMWISDDGTRLFVCGRSLDSVRSYTMSSAWDISTASYDSKTLDVSAKETAPRGLALDPDGNYVYVAGTQNGDVHQYTMSTPFDLATATFTRTFDTSGQSLGGNYGMVFKHDGSKMFLADGDINGMQEYDLSTEWDISTASAGTKWSRPRTGIPQGWWIAEDGNNVYSAMWYVFEQPDIRQHKLTPGYTIRSDANSSNLVLATPFVYEVTGFDDISTAINSGNTQNIAWNGGEPGSRVTQDSANTKWTSPAYGGSAKFDQTGSLVDGYHALKYDITANGRTSFGNAASASYTVEGWFRATNATSNNNWCLSSGDSGGRWLFGINTSGTISFGNENNIGLGDSNFHHIAIVNDSGTHRFYLDGIYKGAWYSVNTGFSTFHVGAFTASGGANFRGNIADLRVYTGLAKYSGTNTGSANFTLPSSIIESF